MNNDALKVLLAARNGKINFILDAPKKFNYCLNYFAICAQMGLIWEYLFTALQMFAQFCLSSAI